MALKKILHIAPMNTSGVPGELVQAERRLGFDSHLVTLYHDRRGYFEDICLNLPFIDFRGTRWIKRRVSAPEKLHVDNRLRIPATIPLVWQPHTLLEKWLVRLRDRLWWPKIQQAIHSHKLDQFDVYQLDGGLDFTREPHFILAMKRLGRKILCCYTGSDLRTRGVIAAIEALSDLNVTVEFDHLQLHPQIHHVFFPFDATRFSYKAPSRGNDRLKIGHAPTHWAAKGSDLIVPMLNRLAATQDIEIMLIQNLPYQKAIALKATCDIFIDQIGDLGYGINALEALVMGIPTCTCLAPGFAEKFPDHPFVKVQINNLEENLLHLIRDFDYRHRLSRYGRSWVEKHHDALQVVQHIHRLSSFE